MHLPRANPSSVRERYLSFRARLCCLQAEMRCDHVHEVRRAHLVCGEFSVCRACPPALGASAHQNQYGMLALLCPLAILWTKSVPRWRASPRHGRISPPLPPPDGHISHAAHFCIGGEFHTFYCLNPNPNSTKSLFFWLSHVFGFYNVSGL